jgi:hypothetical protein
MEPKFFDSESDLFDYVKDPRYEKDPKFPGVCYAFTVNEYADDNYELKMHFYDIYTRLG